MTKEQMISRFNDFLDTCNCCDGDGFTAYMAYCYIFDIRYDVAMRIESKDMTFEAFREWLQQYIYEYHGNYKQVTVFGIYDDVYIK